MDCINISLKLNTGQDDKPFGWKQMILVGDLYQLPPVFEFKQNSNLERKFYAYRATKYFFDAMIFKHNEWFNRPIMKLEKIYRQTDKDFTDLLNKTRDWSATQETLDKLNTRVWIDLWEWSIHLTTLNKMAQNINNEKLAEIKTNATMFFAEYPSKTKVSNLSQMEDVLTVKPWAQIMMLTNTESWRNWTIAKFIKPITKDFCEIEVNWKTHTLKKYEQELIVPYIELWSDKIEYKTIWKNGTIPI